MFAKPKWFKSNSLSAMPMPSSIKGWAFYGICLAGIAIPTLLLIARGQIFPETIIWLGFSLLAFFLEIRGLKRDMSEQEARRNMYRIDDTNSEPVETDQYELTIQ